MLYPTSRPPSSAKAQAVPAWIVFRAGGHEARLPAETQEETWRYVLDVTALGFRADRVGDAIVITGRPSDKEVAIS